MSLYRESKNLLARSIRSWNINRCFSKTEFIFVLCPMRSGSTLLQHLLTGEANYLAAGETKIIYKSDEDLKKLIYKVFSYNNFLGFESRKVVEKCVDNELIENTELVNHLRIKKIFLLRDPISTISSLLRVKGFGHSESVETASKYYMERVENILFLASKIKDSDTAFFLSYDQLVDDQEATLSSLSEFLQTSNPLTATYKTQKWTGVAGIGDITENIRSGKIVKKKVKNDLEMPDELRELLGQTYQNAVDVLQQQCATVRKD